MSSGSQCPLLLQEPCRPKGLSKPSSRDNLGNSYLPEQNFATERSLSSFCGSGILVFKAMKNGLIFKDLVKPKGIGHCLSTPRISKGRTNFRAISELKVIEHEAARGILKRVKGRYPLLGLRVEKSVT